MRGELMPAHVAVLAQPIGVVTGRVGEDVVGAEGGMEVMAEGVCEFGAEVDLDAAQGKVHDGGLADPVGFGHGGW